MAGIDILIGTELALHREALAATFTAMRPALRVRAVPQDELDATVSDLRPLLVICSAVTPSISMTCPAWITLYPGDRDEAIVSIDGARRVIPSATVSQLLGVMDEVQLLRASGS